MTSMTTPAMQPTTMAAIILPSRPPSHDPSSHSDPVSGITTTLRHTQTKHHITTLLPVNMLICIVRYGTIRLLRLHSFRKISPPLPFSLSFRSSVWLSICLSHSGIVGYRNCLIILLSSVYGSPHRSSFPTTKRLYEIPTGSLHTGAVNVGGVCIYIYLAIFWLSQLHFQIYGHRKHMFKVFSTCTRVCWNWQTFEYGADSRHTSWRHTWEAVPGSVVRLFHFVDSQRWCPVCPVHTTADRRSINAQNSGHKIGLKSSSSKNVWHRPVTTTWLQTI